VKLFGSLTDSSVWVEDDKVLRIWIAMLVKADQSGYVRISIPGLARLCGYDIPSTEASILKLESPDPYSTHPDNDGRRLTKVEGGWTITTYNHYRELHVDRTLSDKPYAVAKREYRAKKKSAE
jgi:hypothetical protein